MIPREFPDVTISTIDLDVDDITAPSRTRVMLEGQRQRVETVAGRERATEAQSAGDGTPGSPEPARGTQSAAPRTTPLRFVPANDWCTMCDV